MICNNPTTIYFVLGKPYLPAFVAQPPTGPRFTGFRTIDACDDHVDRIERVLQKGGHQPKRVKV